MVNYISSIQFPTYSGVRCLMMPFVQGDPDSVPDEYAVYEDVIASCSLEPGEIGHLTIDESPVVMGKPHRGNTSRYGRALHTEAGIRDQLDGIRYAWGGGHGWGNSANVYLDRNTQVLLANSLDNTCALWDAEHEDTSYDGDIGYCAPDYPYEDAVLMQAGELYQIGILTPHESLPVFAPRRQFLRVVGQGVEGREPHFTVNPRMEIAA